MKTIDLTHTIEENMPVYPGTEPPKIVEATTVEVEGFAEKLLTLFSHTGTHMDAPAHMLKRGPAWIGWRSAPLWERPCWWTQ